MVVGVVEHVRGLAAPRHPPAAEQLLELDLEIIGPRGVHSQRELPTTLDELLDRTILVHIVGGLRRQDVGLGLAAVEQELLLE